MRFEIMSNQGHTVMDYDLETAQMKFDELVADNMLPVVRDVKTGAMQVMNRFLPGVESIKWMPKLVGG